ncbi:BTAD domain-containing putative transcriptional regulator [Nonomuraea sp. NPDC048882]|uniref:AfsR/SARP family transcriptional regulator n=1 Tax=Nonomuraea sp. NPDC048882 TaxID=3154347 RepID=UPI0033F776A9
MEKIGDGLHFSVLGQLEIVRGGAPVIIAAAKQRVALVALLLQANNLVTRHELIDRIWANDLPVDPSASLHTHIARLRHALRGGRHLIRTHDLGYSIQASAETLDVLRFRHLVGSAAEVRSRDDAGQEAQLLREALALWRGPVLADVASESLHREVVPPLEEERLRAQERWFEVCIRLGEPVEVIPDLRAAVDAHPTHERFWAQLILALSLGGRQVEALETYRTVSELLHTELGLDPGPEIQQAHERINSSLSMVPQAPFQQATGCLVPAELPADTGAFTGRATEVERLCDHMIGGTRQPAIFAISGVGGVGKSALAIHAAHQITSHFPDGQLYVDLHGARVDIESPPPDEVLKRFLRSLGLAEAAVPASVEEAAARFRSMTSDKRVLVVLDNARDAEQVRPLIPGGLGCGVIITSRRTLAPFSGVVHRGLDVLAEEEAGLLLSRLVGPERIEAEPEAAASVVRLCDGLPLALCIVAARLAARPAWSVAALRDRLTSEPHRLAELQMGDRAIRASFEVSYRDLTRGCDGVDAARLFRLLGVFGCKDVGPEAVAALADLPVGRADELLESLVEGQLVEALGTGRYRMHDLLRLYARECAETFGTMPVTAAPCPAACTAAGNWTRRDTVAEPSGGRCACTPA